MLLGFFNFSQIIILLDWGELIDSTIRIMGEVFWGGPELGLRSPEVNNPHLKALIWGIDKALPAAWACS